MICPSEPFTFCISLFTYFRDTPPSLWVHNTDGLGSHSDCHWMPSVQSQSVLFFFFSFFFFFFNHRQAQLQRQLISRNFSSAWMNRKKLAVPLPWLSHRSVHFFKKVPLLYYGHISLGLQWYAQPSEAKAQKFLCAARCKCIFLNIW